MGREIARHPNALPRFIKYRADARRAQTQIEQFKIYEMSINEQPQSLQPLLSGDLEQGEIITLSRPTLFVPEEPIDTALDFVRIYNDEEIDSIIERGLKTA